ncbi:MAG: hypothetical protein C4308_01450 [Chitinophagaceae bacterium]
MVQVKCLGLLLICSYFTQAQTSAIQKASVIIDGKEFSEPGNSIQQYHFQKSKGQPLYFISASIVTKHRPAAASICKGYLFYRIYKAQTTAPAFTQIACDKAIETNAENGMQESVWLNNSFQIDLARLLDTGLYQLELFYGIDASDLVNSCNNSATSFLKNGAEPFKAFVLVTAPLNVKFTGFIAINREQEVELRWSIEELNRDVEYFLLEKSKNGVAWQVLDTSLPAGNLYRYVDQSPRDGVNFYRISAYGNGKTNSSFTRRIYRDRVENIITVYPNPVIKNLRFQMTAIPARKYELAVYTANGKRIISGSILHNGEDNFFTFALPAQTGRGIYWLVLFSKEEFYKTSFFVEQ